MHTSAWIKHTTYLIWTWLSHQCWRFPYIINSTSPLDHLQPSNQAVSWMWMSQIQELTGWELCLERQCLITFTSNSTKGSTKEDSYLMDTQAMFHPALSNCCVLHRIIHFFADANREEKDKHYRLLKEFLFGRPLKTWQWHMLCRKMLGQVMKQRIQHYQNYHL